MTTEESSPQEEARTLESAWLFAGGPPPFDRLEAAEVVPAMERLLAEVGTAFDALEANLDSTWEGLIEPLERMGDQLGRAWGTLGHLLGVQDSDALREAFESMQPAVVVFSLRMGQSAPVYGALCALRDSEAFAEAPDTRKRILASMIRDAEHSGVGLEEEARTRFNEIQLALAELGTSFGNHVLDATKAYGLDLQDPADVEGLPEGLRALAADAAEGPEATAENGPWRFTLEAPSFIPFMEHCRSSGLRERLYRAYITRASTGELDNAGCIDEILALRREQAAILGYASYADLSLSTKMADDSGAVEGLLEELRLASREPAADDLEELQKRATAAGDEEVALWDIAYWAQRVREERFAYSEEELRPYFPLPRVLEGLFALAERLFGIRVMQADGEVPVWHPDVRYFRVEEIAGGEIAAFYLDPYSRPAEKRGGAWMDECTGRSALLGEDGRTRLPVAYLVCNQTPPGPGGKPSLMTFDEVRTLFHEFGHGLQHMLTRVDEGLASGIRNVEWDAVELPSQFMENWLYHRETLLGLARHFETDAPLPEALFEKILAARTYRAGSDMLRQVYFARIDLELHGRNEEGEGEGPFEVQRRVAEGTTVLPPLAEDRFLCSFSHIFAGGYAAGYYSYKWAEVLSADAFGAFEEAGLDDAAALAKVGQRYRETILALGGSQHPLDVFRAFRGREPSSQPLLRHSGLA